MKLLPLLTVSTALVFAPAALAQHSDHDGHDHSAHAKAPAGPVVPGTFEEVAADHTLGRVDAPVTLMVFASVTCPHCASWFEGDWPTLKRDYVDTGKVRVIFREFPTPPVQVAVAGFLLADCGGEDKYFERIEWQMANQSRIIDQLRANKVQETFEEIGANAGLSATETQTCLSTQARYDDLNAAVTRARGAGLQAVPAMMLNGELWASKDTSADALSTAIDAKIAAQ